MNVLKRTWFGVLALALATAWLIPEVQAEDKKADGSVTGTWKATVIGPDGKTFNIVYKLKQAREKLTGTVKREKAAEIKIEKGKVKDGKLSFQVEVERDGRKFTVKYEGRLSGDAIKGKYAVGDSSREWVAKRQKRKK